MTRDELRAEKQRLKREKNRSQLGSLADLQPTEQFSELPAHNSSAEAAGRPPQPESPPAAEEAAGPGSKAGSDTFPSKEAGDARGGGASSPSSPAPTGVGQPQQKPSTYYDGRRGCSVERQQEAEPL